MNLDRRTFLKTALILWWITKTSLVFASKMPNEEVKDDVEQIITNENKLKFEKSILAVWENEVNFFLTFFNLKTKESKIDDFVETVNILQKEFFSSWKSIDWILWSDTLKQIYLNYYLKKLEKLDQNQLKRLEIYQKMLWYEKKSGALYRWLNVFNYMTYYWKWNKEPKENTFISQDLIWKIPENIGSKINKILVYKLNKKTILTFYIDWNLYLSTYVSAWTLKNKTPKLNTFWQKKPDLYHTSSEYPKRWWRKWWAIMPYAVHIDWPIWLHWSDWQVDWMPHSHWCIRVPLFYIDEIYTQVSKLWIKNVLIDTKNIY